ncbi:protein E9 [Elephant endotheliotropic herpesvirus 3A]|uniref:Protein E9 n=1 Tax=Elephant endotheliotropic herpesvirus 3A TaxID=1329409 RepID=A0A866VSB7_9BETA|nr:protein E9 [Elephant endotheliotropic herpesvirus 3A]QOE74371.1 protein E9 [Elephant endotheliotropic herpesvirus 3A]
MWDDNKVENVFAYYVQNYTKCGSETWNFASSFGCFYTMIYEKFGLSSDYLAYTEKYLSGGVNFYLKSDGYITLTLVMVFIVSLLLCVFQYPKLDGSSSIKRYTVYPDIICLCSITNFLVFNFYDFKFLFRKSLTVAKNVLGSDASYVFFNTYLCVYVFMCLCVLYSILYIKISQKNRNLKHKYVSFIRKINRRMLIYLVYMLLKVDYSFLSSSYPIRSSSFKLIENIVIFLLYYLTFFLISELCDESIGKGTRFSWKIWVLITICIYVYDKHVYYNNAQEPHIFKKYLSFDFNMYSFLIYLFTKYLLLL